MKTKSEFVYIEPKNTDSRLTFEIDFKGLHSCKVMEKHSDKILVKSIAGDYYFWINKEKDPNWSLIK
jgi:hypothetical protein